MKDEATTFVLFCARAAVARALPFGFEMLRSGS
jgi:hypothetical protein